MDMYNNYSCEGLYGRTIAPFYSKKEETVTHEIKII
jgi:hypothetical protein